MKTSRPLLARIDLAALRHNHALLRRRAPTAKLWAVVKANAYGHGIWRAVEALRSEADGFALLECETAFAMREAGVTQPILLIEGIFSVRDARQAVEQGIASVVHAFEQLAMLRAVARPGEPLALCIKLNTGMNRLGFGPADLPRLQAELALLPQAQMTWMTHFANADDERGVAWQLQRFREMTPGWQGPVSLANSAALLRYPETHADWVRPGIALYGSSPFADESAAAIGLQPVMSLESKLIGVQSLAPGERVGYGGLFTAERPTRIGIVACGYADGYPRVAPTGTPIAVCGQRTRTLGRVSMDMLACDITDIPEAGLGAPVTLWGWGLGGEVAADEVAAAAGTLAYELFCGLAPRVAVEVLRSGG